jgi:hypothetical protein
MKASVFLELPRAHAFENALTDLLLPKQVNTLTNYYILPDLRGKPGVGAGVSRH